MLHGEQVKQIYEDFSHSYHKFLTGIGWYAMRMPQMTVKTYRANIPGRLSGEVTNAFFEFPVCFCTVPGVPSQEVPRCIYSHTTQNFSNIYRLLKIVSTSRWTSIILLIGPKTHFLSSTLISASSWETAPKTHRYQPLITPSEVLLITSQEYQKKRT